MFWKTSRRRIPLDRAQVMAILNVTPDSFSDGGRFVREDDALRRAEEMIAAGADVIDIGGESTRPGSARIAAEEECRRVVPVIEAIARRFETPISIDTSKSEVAAAAVNAGAEIINDISGLRFDPDVAKIAGQYGAGLVLMHLRGTFETMHTQSPVDDILDEVSRGFRLSIETAFAFGVAPDALALDIGIGFSKTYEQNLELLAKLDKLTTEFSEYPVLVGSSRKSFIGRLLGEAPLGERLVGSLTTAALAVWNGARIVRVHDVKETVDALKVVEALKRHL